MPIVKIRTKQAAATMTERILSTMGHFEMDYWDRSVDVLAFRDYLLNGDVPDLVTFQIDREIEARLDPADTVPGSDLQSSLPVLDSCKTTALLQDAAGPLSDAQVRGAPRCGQTSEKSTDHAFEIELASTGEVVYVRSDQTAIEALREHEVSIPTACEQGRCGACVTRILDGVPEHRDVFLTFEEHADNDRFTPCCSRAKGRLVIDL